MTSKVSVPSTRATTWALALCALGFAFWVLCAQGNGAAAGKGWADDYAYTHSITARDVGSSDDYFFASRGPEITTFAQAASSVVPHYLGVNGRLANVLMFFFALLPGWLKAVVQGLAYAAMLGAVMRLTLGPDWRRRPLPLVAMCMLLWVVLPWESGMVSVDFQLNYVWSTAMCLWVLVAFMSHDMRRRLRWLPLAAVAALMHEAISVAVSTAMLIWIVAHRREYSRDLRLLWLPALFMLFALVPLLAPSLWRRAASVSAGGWPLSMWAQNLWPFVIAGPVALWLWLRGRCRTLLAMMWGAIAVGFLCAYIGGMLGRAMWLPRVLAACTLMLPLRGRTLFTPRRSLILAAVLTAVLAAWYAALCTYQQRFSMEREQVLAELRAGRTLLTTPVAGYYDTPWWLLSIPGQIGERGRLYRYNLSGEAFGDTERAYVTGLGRDPRTYFASPRPIPGKRALVTFVPDTARHSGMSPILCLSHLLRRPGKIEKWVDLEQTAVPLPGSSDTIYYYRPTPVPLSAAGWAISLARYCP